jgi:hypothetical protein
MILAMILSMFPVMITISETNISKENIIKKGGVGGRRQLMSSLFNIILIVHRASRSNNLQLYVNRSTLTVDSKHKKSIS